ncbi:MAG: TolC family protein [Bryobacterales bacterium]
MALLFADSRETSRADTRPTRPQLRTLRAAFHACLLASTLFGCVKYERRPLEHDAIENQLLHPDRAGLRIQAKELNHPLLKPLEINERDGLSPSEAAVLAVLANPSIQAVRARRGVAAAQLILAGVLPDPQLASGLDFPAGGSEAGTVTAFNTGLNWNLQSLITRSARVQAARARAESVDLSVSWQEWQVAEGAKLNVYRITLMQAQINEAQVAIRALQENLDLVKKAVDIGEMTIVDLDAARSSLRAIELSLVDLQQRRAQEWVQLKQALGLPQDDEVVLQSGIDPPKANQLPTEAELIAALAKSRLDLTALRKGYDSQDATFRAAVQAQFPPVNIGLAQARDTGNVVTGGFGLSINLPFLNGNRAQASVEAATRRQLLVEYRARLFEAISNIRVILTDLQYLRQKLIAQQRALQTSRALVTTYENALRLGQADALVYYNARNNMISQQIALYGFKLALAERFVALEIASGMSLSEADGGAPN